VTAKPIETAAGYVTDDENIHWASIFFLPSLGEQPRLFGFMDENRRLAFVDGLKDA
jgi:hypothetical protein